jgi:hypothetical protein
MPSGYRAILEHDPAELGGPVLAGLGFLHAFDADPRDDALAVQLLCCSGDLVVFRG